jgi:hypothetical protein
MRGGLVVGGARLLASSSLALLLFVVAPTAALASSTGPACGHANANNPGHHYGLIKNGCWPASAPKPVLSPVPAPKLPPTAVTPPGHVSVATPPASKPAAVVPAALTPSSTGAIAPALRSSKPGNVPAIDHNLWVVTALLPSLLVIWLLLAGRVAAGNLRPRPAPAKVTA